MAAVARVLVPIDQFGTAGQLRHPRAVCCRADGTILIADYLGNNIVQLNERGAHLPLTVRHLNLNDGGGLPPPPNTVHQRLRPGKGPGVPRFILLLLHHSSPQPTPALDLDPPTPPPHATPQLSHTWTYDWLTGELAVVAGSPFVTRHVDAIETAGYSDGNRQHARFNGASPTARVPRWVTACRVCSNSNWMRGRVLMHASLSFGINVPICLPHPDIYTLSCVSLSPSLGHALSVAQTERLANRRTHARTHAHVRAHAHRNTHTRTRTHTRTLSRCLAPTVSHGPSFFLSSHTVHACCGGTAMKNTHDRSKWNICWPRRRIVRSGRSREQTAPVRRRMPAIATCDPPRRSTATHH